MFGYAFISIPVRDPTDVVFCIGLDALKHRGAIEAPEREFKTLESQLTDAQRFKDCKSFALVCRDCKTEHTLRNISEKSVCAIVSLADF